MQISGRKLHVEVRGEGAPLLWIHAFPLSSRMFRHQSELPDFHHILPDLPGFGESSETPPASTLGESADLLFELMTSLGAPRFIAAGVSMGGYLIMEMLRRDPARLRAMVLMDTRAGADDDTGRANRIRQAERAEAEGVEFLASDMPSRLLSTHSTGPLHDEVASMIRRASAGGVSAALRAMAERPDSLATLQTSRQIPCLVVVGEDDSLTPPSEAEVIRDATRGTLARIPRAGHLACLERPEAVNAELAEFLMRQQG